MLGAAGDQWNQFLGSFSDSSSRTNLALNDATGAASGVTLSYSGLGGYFNSSFSGNQPLMASTSYATLLSSYGHTGGTATFTFSGLTAGASYDLVIYAIANAAGRKTDVTVDGVTQSVVAAATPGLVAGSTYAEFVNETANGSGRIVIAVASGAGSNEGDVNGIQLTDALIPAPEPGSVTLLAAGLTMLGWRRLRRSRAV